VEGFPKCVYVRTVDSRITVFTMHVFCYNFAMVFHLYFVVLRELFGYGLLAVEVFPKCVYVRTVDSRITVFNMHVFCCNFAMVFHLYFVVLREHVGAVT